MGYVKKLIYAGLVALFLTAGTSQAVTFQPTYVSVGPSSCLVEERVFFLDPTVFQRFKRNTGLQELKPNQNLANGFHLVSTQTIYGEAASTDMMLYPPIYAESYHPAQLSIANTLPVTCDSLKGLDAVVSIVTVITRGRSLLQSHIPPVVSKWVGLVTGVAVGVALLATIPETAPVAVGLAGKCVAGVAGGTVASYLAGSKTLTMLDGAIYGCLSASVVPFARDKAVPIIRAAYASTYQSIRAGLAAFQLDPIAAAVNPEVAIGLAEIAAR